MFSPHLRAYANLRQSSLDGMTTSRGHHSHHHKPRSSSSETNLRKLTMGEFGGGLAGLGAGGSAPPGGRPGSALGLLQGRTRGEQNLTLRHLPDTLYLVTQSSSSVYYHSLCHVDDAIFCQFVEITLFNRSSCATVNRSLFGPTLCRSGSLSSIYSSLGRSMCVIVIFQNQGYGEQVHQWKI